MTHQTANFLEVNVWSGHDVTIHEGSLIMPNQNTQPFWLAFFIVDMDLKEVKL